MINKNDYDTLIPANLKRFHYLINQLEEFPDIDGLAAKLIDRLAALERDSPQEIGSELEYLCCSLETLLATYS